MIPAKSMLLISSQRQGVPTFRMMPLTEDCPFIEAVYEPRAMALIIFYKHQVEGLHMVDQIDGNGDSVRALKPRASGNPNKEERKMLRTAHETYITNKAEIQYFVMLMAHNQEFNYAQFMVDPKLAVATETSKIILPS